MESGKFLELIERATEALERIADVAETSGQIREALIGLLATATRDDPNVPDTVKEGLESLTILND